MGIERLLYEASGENPMGIQYEGSGAIQTLRAKGGIGPTFTQGDTIFRDNIAIVSQSSGNSIYRMGWDTAAIFTVGTNGFQVQNIYDVDTGEEWEKATDLQTTSFSQITTHGVDTCTLYWIKAENAYLFAHFNMSKLGAFENLLTTILEEQKLQNIEAIFCSMLEKQYSEDRQIKAYNSIKGRVPGDSYTFFNRTKYEDTCYFSHMEFGIGWNKGNLLTYFGDVCLRTPQTYKLGEVNPETTCRCSIFEYNQMRDLANLEGHLAVILETEFKGGGSGGGCIIV